MRQHLFLFIFSIISTPLVSAGPYGIIGVMPPEVIHNNLPRSFYNNYEDLRLPVLLYSKSNYGYTTLSLNRELDSGFYTLIVKFETSSWRKDFIARIDNREIEFRSGYFSHDPGQEPPVYRFDFILNHPGNHLIEIDRYTRSFSPENPGSPVTETPLKILELSIEKKERPYEWENQEISTANQPFYHLWGWMACSTYQRRHNFKITEEYWKEKIVNEPLKWGANFIQLYPTAHKDYLKDFDIYEALNYAHKKGFIVDEHALGGGELDTERAPLEELYENLERHMIRFYDRTRIKSSHGMDTWESEHYGSYGMTDRGKLIEENLRQGTKENLIKTNNICWDYHPGVNIANCHGAHGEYKGYQQWLHEGFHGPNYSKILMCAGGYKGGGYDDMDAIELIPENGGFINEYNRVFRAYQADSRPYTHNVFSGTSSLDWIAKEVGDFFRMHAYDLKENRQPINTALAFLGEPDFTLPEEMRHWVYAMTMDPCRSALAYPLISTGHYGEHYHAPPHWKQHYNVIHYRPREWSPSSNVRIHNGILAAEQSVFGDGMKLCFDTERLGQFDLNSEKINLLKTFCQTQIHKDNLSEYSYRIDSFSKGVKTLKAELPEGTYRVKAEFKKTNEPYRAELLLNSQYLGSIDTGDKQTDQSFFCYVANDNETTIELRHSAGNIIEPITLTFTPTYYKVDKLFEIGISNDSSREFQPVKIENSENLPSRYSCFLDKKSIEQFPSALESEGDFPRAIDLYFDSEIASYLLVVRARGEKGQELRVSLNSHRYCFENYRPGTGNDWLGKPGIRKVIGKLKLSDNWETFQVPVLLAHRGGKRKHKIELSISENSSKVEFDMLSLYQCPVRHDYTMPGGHQAQLTQDFQIQYDDIIITEKRNIKVRADEPSIALEIMRETNGNNFLLDSIFNYEGYENLYFNQKRQVRTGNTSAIPDIISFSDNEGLKPDLHLLLTDKSLIESLSWGDDVFTIISSVSDKQKLRMTATLRADLSVSEDMNYFQLEPEKVSLNRKSKEFHNNSSHEMVKAVQIEDPSEGPYFVREKGWWSVRGAQPLTYTQPGWLDYLDKYEKWALDKDNIKMPITAYGPDIVRLHIEPGGISALEPYGFINNILRPGRGSQKQLLCGEITPTSCLVKVLSTTSYVFAPRVEFKKKFTSVKLDGRDWAYHDSRNVFLPQKPGEYLIEVKDTGTGYDNPKLENSAASIKRAFYHNNELEIEWEFPDYVFALPEGLAYKFFISYNGNRNSICSVRGGELVREGKFGGIVKANRNILHVRFKKTEGSIDTSKPVSIVFDGMIEADSITGQIKRIAQFWHHSDIGFGQPTVEKRSYFGLDIEGLNNTVPGKVKIRKALLKFYTLQSGRIGKAGDLKLFSCLKDKTSMKEIKWADPSKPVGDAISSASGWKYIDITPFLQEDVDLGRSISVYYLSMDSTNAGSNTKVAIATSERKGNNCPSIEVIYE